MFETRVPQVSPVLRDLGAAATFPTRTPNTPHNPKLQRLNRNRQRLPLRFAHQQMNMFRHDDIPQHHEPDIAAEPVQESSGTNHSGLGL